MQKNMVRKIAHIAVLVALEIVLSRFLSINTFNLKIGFSFVPVVAAALLYGPLGGAATAGLADFAGALLFPVGPYFPGFTLTAMLIGATYGVLLHRRQSMPRVIFATLIARLPLSLVVNTFWISILYGKAFFVLIPGRIVQELVLIPIQVVGIWFIATKLPQLFKRPVG